MRMQEEYPKIEKLPKKEKEAQMKVFEDQMETTGKESDKAWAQSGELRMMRMVLQAKEPKLLAEIDEFDMMEMMMGGGRGGGGRGRGGGGRGAPKKKKKKAAVTKDEV